MKSTEVRQPVTFSLVQDRLVGFVQEQVNNGDFTERGLARLLGISQPQLHNVLKGKRKLQPALADRIMQKFEMDLLDLVQDGELRARFIAGSTIVAVQDRDSLVVEERSSVPKHSQSDFHR